MSRDQNQEPQTAADMLGKRMRDYLIDHWYRFDGVTPIFLAKNIWLGVSIEDQKMVDGYTMYRVGKSAAGRLIDGKFWNQYPGDPNAS